MVNSKNKLPTPWLKSFCDTSTSQDPPSSDQPEAPLLPLCLAFAQGSQATAVRCGATASRPPKASPRLAEGSSRMLPSGAERFAHVLSGRAGPPGHSGSPGLPRTHVGSRPDGTLRLNPHGSLVAEPALRRRFDYLLLAEDDMSAAALTRLVCADLATALPPGTGRAAAFDLWQRYVAFRRQARQLMDPGRRAAGLQGLRSRFFSAGEAAGLFADRLPYEAHAEAALTLLRRAPSAQRQAAWAALERTGPLAERQRQARSDPEPLLRAAEAYLRDHDRGRYAAALRAHGLPWERGAWLAERLTARRPTPQVP